jgi:cellulose synthase (UDP-forming)
MPLPAAPSRPPENQWRPHRLEALRNESTPAVTGRSRVQLWLLTGFWLAGELAFWTWWLRPERVLSPAVYAAFTAALAYYSTILPGACLFFVGRMRRPQHRPPPAGLRVAMVTTCVPSCESLAVIARQFAALVSVTYPHDSWVLDDEGDPAVRQLAEQHGVRYFSRAGVAKYNQRHAPFQAKTKAGNVNAWIDTWGDQYEFFVQLDVDHRPRPDYLDCVLGFFREPAVAWVQAPSVYDNLESWVARGAAEQELIFQGPLQQGFYGYAEMPFIIGSHTTYRLAALRSIGGFQPTRAEDHLDTLMLAAHGGKGVFVPETIAFGDGPETFEIYVRQQFAWARSIMQVMFGYTPGLLNRLRPRQAILLLFGETWYLLWSASLLIMFAVPLTSLITQAPPAKISFLEFAAHAWPMPTATSLLWLWSRPWHAPQGLPLTWRGVLLNAARWPVVFWAFINVVLRIGHPYMITPKGGVHRGAAPRFNWRAQAPYLAATWLSCGAVSLALTQHAYAGDGAAWANDSGILGSALLTLWGALFMLAVYAVNALESISRLRGWVSGTSGLFRLVSVPLLLLALSSMLFVAAVVSVERTVLERLGDTWPSIPKPEFGARLTFVAMPSGPGQGTATPPALPLDLPAGRIAIGGYDPGNELTSLPLDFQHFYVSEEHPDGLRAALSTTRNRRVPLVTIEPYPPAGDARPTLDTILLGDRDQEIGRLADIAAAAKPQVVYVRWGQEMDLSGLYPWAANDPAMFRAAFRHVVALFREHGASNVKWLWSPAGIHGAEAYYPGDDVVDDIGLTVLGDAVWDGGYGLPPQSFAELLQPKYDLVDRFNKPIIIAEMGVSGGTDRQRQWLAQIPSVLERFPLVRGIAYFDAINSDNNRMAYRPDWRVPPAVLSALLDALRPS